MRSMRSTISIGVCTYGTVPSSQPQVWVCPHAGVASSAKTSQRFRKIKEKSSSGKMAFHAPVAQWIEQPPPKGQVARSIRVRGASIRASEAGNYRFRWANSRSLPAALSSGQLQEGVGAPYCLIGDLHEQGAPRGTAAAIEANKVLRQRSVGEHGQKVLAATFLAAGSDLANVNTHA
jgi:hypothetical protein